MSSSDIVENSPPDSGQPLIISRDKHNVSRKNMTEEVLKVLYRLKSQGHVAYLCGGGVRDLLLGKKPKDFDVATDARPGRLKKIFHNAWLVGRRFRLAHMVFKGGKIVEVSTFRRQAEIPETVGDSLLISHDNTFGTEAEDALRRDFTINALYYNIVGFSIIDYVGGMEDITRKLIRSVGDPFIRFQEDPLRICRGIRFAVHLGFRIEENTWKAMVEHGPKLSMCAPPRVQEELLRLMRGGSMTEGFSLLRQTNSLYEVLPEIAYLAERPESEQFQWEIFRAMDRLRSGESPYSDAMLWASVFLQPMFDALDKAPVESDPANEGYEYLRGPGARLNIPKAVRRQMLQILLDARNMLTLPTGQRSGHRKSRLFVHADFAEALKLLEVFLTAKGGDLSIVDIWRQEYQTWLERKAAPVKKKRRRKKRARKKRLTGVPQESNIESS